VDADAELAGRGDRRLEDVERPDAPARRAVRLLEHDHRGRLQDAVAEPVPLPQVRGREPARLGRDTAHDEAAVRGGAARLVHEHVRPLLREQLAAARPQQAERDLVRHRRRRDEERRLLTEQLGRAALQLVHGRVLAPLLVAEPGRGHRRVHLGRRRRGGVGAEVDHDRSLPSLSYKRSAIC
jgi:hypothetical protein